MPADLITALRTLVVESLRLSCAPDSIEPDAPLFGGDLGLDSLDAVQLLTAIEQRFAIRLTDSELAGGALTSLSRLAELIRDRGCG